MTAEAIIVLYVAAFVAMYLIVRKVLLFIFDLFWKRYYKKRGF